VNTDDQPPPLLFPITLDTKSEPLQFSISKACIFFTHLVVTNYVFRGCDSNDKMLVIYTVLHQSEDLKALGTAQGL